MWRLEICCTSPNRQPRPMSNGSLRRSARVIGHRPWFSRTKVVSCALEHRDRPIDEQPAQREPAGAGTAPRLQTRNALSAPPDTAPVRPSTVATATAEMAVCAGIVAPSWLAGCLVLAEVDDAHATPPRGGEGCGTARSGAA